MPEAARSSFSAHFLVFCSAQTMNTSSGNIFLVRLGEFRCEDDALCGRVLFPDMNTPFEGVAHESVGRMASEAHAHYGMRLRDDRR